MPLAQRRITRPYCSVHWLEGAEKALLPADKVFRRETRSKYQANLIHLLERDGKVVALSDQTLWKMIEEISGRDVLRAVDLDAGQMNAALDALRDSIDHIRTVIRVRE